MPIEPAFAVALNQDAQLHNFPLKKYVIVTPTTLHLQL
jgi:DNA anti-recombination protein RmuC